MTFRALVLDCDGVIVENRRFSRCLEREYGIGLEQTAPFFEERFPRCLVGAADLKAELAPFLPAWRWKQSLDEFLALWFAEDGHLDLEVLDVVRNVRRRGFPVYVATNNEPHRVRYLREHLGFASEFDAVFASGEIGLKKPDAAFFHHIQRLIGVPAEHILFWDDAPEFVKGARGAGWDARLFTSANELRRHVLPNGTAGDTSE